METSPRVSLLARAVLGLTLFGLLACASSSQTNTPASDTIPSAVIESGASGQPTTIAEFGTPKANPDSSGSDPLAQIPACPADISTPLFDTIPIAPDDFIAFRPLGFMSPPIHIFPAKHSAFSMTLPGNEPVAKPVRAPSPAWVVEIWEISISTGGANYQVFLYPCREVRLYFGHIVSLSEKLMGGLRESQPTCASTVEGTVTFTRCRHEDLLIALEAGEQFGMGPDTAGVDFGLIDFRRAPAEFIVPEHYDYFYLYYASPLDYFTPEARSVLASKTGSVFGDKIRTAEPIGGTYMQDIPGTAQGNWFPPGTYLRDMPDVGPLLALAHDYVDPTKPLFGIGTSIKGVNPGLYSFQIETQGLINRDFSEVRADGKTYCYENFLQGRAAGGMPLGNLSGILLLSMPRDTTLKIELATGGSCQDNAGWTSTANATTFER